MRSATRPSKNNPSKLKPAVTPAWCGVARGRGDNSRMVLGGSVIGIGGWDLVIRGVCDRQERSRSWPAYRAVRAGVAIDCCLCCRGVATPWRAGGNHAPETAGGPVGWLRDEILQQVGFLPATVDTLDRSVGLADASGAREYTACGGRVGAEAIPTE